MSVHSVSPVLTEDLIEGEQVIALEQEEYYPIIVCRIIHKDGMRASYSRFRFSDEDRALIAGGADLILGQPHHGPMMPISIDLAMPGEISKDWI